MEAFRKFCLGIGALWMLVALGACTPDSSHSAGGHQADRRVTAEPFAHLPRLQATPLELRIGQEAVVQLKGDPGVGKFWRYRVEPAWVAQAVELDALSDDPEADLAKSTYYWVFQAKAPGEARLHFVYAYENTRDTLAYEVFRLQVTEADTLPIRPGS
jgi:predicted secreted protein